MSQRLLLLVAGALALLALSLPWGATEGTPGVLLPGGSTVVVNVDGTLSLQLGPGTYLPGLSGRIIHGAEHEMRVLGAAGALFVLFGVRRSQRRLVVIGLLVAALALPMGLAQGTGIGRIAYGLAIGLAALTLLRRPAPSTST